MKRALCAILLLASGCTVVPPGPLEEDPRYKNLLRENGHVSARGSLYVHRPRLERPPNLVLAEDAPVSFDDDEHSWYWPEAVPETFEQELRDIIRKNPGFELELWTGHDDAEVLDRCDYELELVVSTYRLELSKIGLASSMASLFPLGLVHLSSFYNAPDEFYRCEYRLKAVLKRRKGSWRAEETVVASKELALTDFQRGWTLYSWWPEQKLGWLPPKDAVTAWKEYAPSIIRNVEPHARRGLLIDLLRFVRNTNPPPRNGEPPRPLTLAVGVPDPKGTQTRAGLATEDAAAVAALLGATDTGQAQLLVEAEATADELQRRLWTLLSGVREGQRVVVFFAGVGEWKAGRPLLHLTDRPSDLARVLEPLRAMAARGAVPVLVLDTGFFGGDRCASGELADAKQLLQGLAPELGPVHLWLAGDDGAGAPIDSDVRHGVMTQLFISGLTPGMTLADLAASAPHTSWLGAGDRELPLLRPRPKKDEGDSD